MKLKRSASPLIALTALIALVGCSAAPASSTAPSGDASSQSGSGATNVMGGPEGTTTFAVTASTDLASQAAAIITDGTVEVVTRAGVPPYEYIVEGTDELRGVDIDITKAIAAKLGLKANFNLVEFAGILPAMQAKRYDFSIASMGDTPEREKVVDFVDYSTDSNSIVTVKGNPKGITGMDSLCGLKISSVEGSVMLGLLEEQNKKCDTKMDITIFPDNANSLLQVQTGRADATMYQTGITAYLIKTDEAATNLEIIGNTEFGKGYNAIAVSKDNSALRDLIQKALIELQSDGVYDAVHDAWGLGPNKVAEITVNDGLKYNQPS